jgi:hypothetical protein
MDAGRVKIELDHDEAFVLFDFLSRFAENRVLQIDDQAEERVLWDIQCSLEKSLPNIIESDYFRQLKESRDLVRDKD